MFQQTIQDVLSLAEASGRPEDVLRCVHARISAFEAFESGELLAQTSDGLRRFVVAPGLGDIGPNALAALGDHETLRIDTVADMETRGLSTGPGTASLLILGIGAPGVIRAAIVLGHSRAWSFAGAPIARVRTIGEVALRLVLSTSGAEAHKSPKAKGSEGVTPRRDRPR